LKGEILISVRTGRGHPVKLTNLGAILTFVGTSF
jgi:hypothetical protein